jgi:hypothetical protein
MHSRVVIVDEFYADPDAVRAFALRSDFGSAGRYNYPGWQSVKALQSGALQGAFERLLNRPIEVDAERYTWGGFRIITEATGHLTKVHADQAVDWAALVYLTPDAPMTAGTGFFRHRATGLEAPPSDALARQLGYEDADDFELNVARRDMADLDAWELVGEVGPVYNRLVLFRGAELYHAPLGGWGSTPATARMTHNFFFNEAPASPRVARRLTTARQ